MIEQRGKAAAVICTEQFATSARTTAQTFGMAGYPFAEILHPIGRVSEKELSERAEVAFPQAGLQAGSHTFFSLEGALTNAVLTARQGHISGVNYLALGDSFSAGEGNPPFLTAPVDTNSPTDRCHRSAAAYPELINNLARGLSNPMPIANFENWACSGATRENNVVFDGSGEVAQINHVTSSTNLVTISVGGNDVGFADVLADCIFGKDAHGTARCQLKPVDDPDGSGQVPLWQREQILLQRLTEDVNGVPPLHKLYENIVAKMAPNGHIVVLLYPHLFTNTPDNSGCHVLSGLGLPTETMSYLNVLWLNHETDLLDNTISSEVAIAKQAGVNIDIADPRQAFGDNEVPAVAGHGVCGNSPWVNKLMPNASPFTPSDCKVGSGPVSPCSFHPNQDGQKAFYRTVMETLGFTP